MADEADVANDYIDNVLRAWETRQNRGPDSKKLGPKTCIECGEKIPDPRRKLGFRLCIECATEKERHRSLFAN